MASKIASILSLSFVVLFFLFASDLMCLQYLYSSLDSTAVTIGYLMAKNKVIDDYFKTQVETNYQIEFIYDGPIKPAYGEVVDYKITKIFKPIIISATPMNINVRRSTVIGYYG